MEFYASFFMSKNAGCVKFLSLRIMQLLCLNTNICPKPYALANISIQRWY